MLNSETASIKTLWIVLGVIGALAIGSSVFGISHDDQTVGVPAAAAAGEAVPNR